MPQESNTSQCQILATVSSSSVTATPDRKNIAEAFDKTLEKITNKINEVSLDTTPAGKQLPQNNSLKISPTDSERSESSGHSGESSGQTSSTSISEDFYESKVSGRSTFDEKSLYIRGQLVVGTCNKLKVLEEKPESDLTAPSSPVNSAFDRFASVSSSQRQTFSAQQKIALPGTMKPSSSRIISTQEKVIQECITPKTSSRIRCVACIHGNILLSPCGHRMCEPCVHDLRTNTVKSSCKTYSECIFCETPVAEFKKIVQMGIYPTVPKHNERTLASEHPEETAARTLSLAFPGMTQTTTRPVQPMTAIANRPQQVQFGELSKLAVAHNWPVIPWDVSLKEIKAFFSAFKLPNASLYAQCIHIIMDRTTGKTLSEAYVELATLADAHRAVDTRNMKPLKGRLVSCMRSSQEDLMRAIFPKWKGEFSGCDAVVTADVLQSSPTVPHVPYITREEMNSLLVVCRNYKLHFSRKCAERPFENIISVLVKFPFHQGDLYTTLQRDLLFEMLKLAIESLKIHLSKDYHRIDETLLERMMRAGIMTPVFTERQKLMILQVSGMALPEDLQDRLSPFKKDDDEMDHDPEINNQVNSTPDATRPSGSSDTSLLPTNLLSSPHAEFVEYKGHFNPFRDDHEAKANFLHNELKLAQSQVRAATATVTSRVPITPPRPQLGTFQAFDVWNRLNERRNAEFGRF
ncbi:17208_t:CDS:10 [Acaulospora morrowiae]|uniref:17208_t:CDS:1 n=1 Tax=Acaulospora morrowiae TaxID=94023 RepID=A0A9N8WRZ6_9GLOM|nr:17208_t:CDS:10 [Acaulospora morrowiae]